MALELKDNSRFNVIELVGSTNATEVMTEVPYKAGQLLINDNGEIWYDVSVTSVGTNGRLKLENSLESGITAIEGEIDALEGRVGTLEAQVSTIDGEVTQLQTDVQAAQSAADAAQADVDALEAKVGNANGIAELDGEGKVPLTQMPDALIGAVVYQGTFNPTTGQDSAGTAIPAAATENKGHYYIASVAGSFTPPSQEDPIEFDIGDWLISDGTKWSKVDNVDAVTSVNGKKGAVVIGMEDIDGLQEAIQASNNTFYEVTATAEQDDTTAIGTVATAPKHGDVAVVIRNIDAAGTKKSRTAYFYDTNTWKALDGNYNAENVYFAEDLMTTSAIGNITLTGGQATIPAAGKNLKEVFDTIFVKEDSTSLKTGNVAANITGVSLQYIEVGSSASATGTVVLSEDGAYKYGYTTERGSDGDSATSVVNNGTTGVTVNSLATPPYTMSYKVGSGIATPLEATEENGAVFQINSGVQTAKASASVIANVAYTDGYNPVSNLKKMYPSQKIKAASATKTTELFRWYVPLYSGFKYSDTVIADPANITEQQIKDLTITKDATAYNQTVPSTARATKSWRQYFIAVPEVWAKNLTAVKDSNNLTLTVSHANDVTLTLGTASINYKVFYINNAADYDTVQISLTW